MIQHRSPRNWRRMILPRLLPYSRWGLAGRIIRRADSVRGEFHYLAAAMLYEEAAGLVPRDAALHIQCGHMFKEAGELARAERHYRIAFALDAADPDLSLQIGHFYKVAGRPDEAAAAYARAARLAPGWAEPVEELAMLGRSAAEFEAAAAGDVVLPLEGLLAQQPAATRLADRDRIEIRQLGRRRARAGGGAATTLAGIEAVRGFALCSAALVELRILIADELVYRGPVERVPAAKGSGGRRKVCFNSWIDVTSFRRGVCQVEIQLWDANRPVLSHREQLVIGEPLREADHPGADAAVTLPAGGGNDETVPLEQRIRARPSMVRPATRSILPGPPRTVLVQRVDQLGDLIVSIPAIRRLREIFAGARLVGLLSSANADFAATLGLFDDIVVADLVADPLTGARTLPSERQLALGAQLARFAFDVAVDLSEDAASRSILRLSGAKFLHGFGRREFPWLDSDVEGATPDPANGLETASHASKLLAMVEWLGAMLGGHHRPMPSCESERARLIGYGIRHGDRYAILHSGARLAFSRWPHYAALAALLLERTPLKVVILNDDPATAAACRQQLPSSDRLHILEGKLPFADFDALLGLCAVFVGNDSGPKHLAALRGAKVISLHLARLNWSEWGQEGDGFVISRRVPCAGCAIHRNPEECAKGFACINDISAEEVFKVVRLCLNAA